MKQSEGGGERERLHQDRNRESIDVKGAENK